MDKQTIERDQEVIFHNWTDKDFTGIWIDGPYKVSSSPVAYSPVKRKVYEVKAGKSYYLPFYLAEKFAKEIADRVYWTTFNRKLEGMRGEKGNERLERRQLEHLVQTSNEIRALNIQAMIDKCVEIIEGENVEMVKPMEVKMKEVVLERDKRAKEQIERYGFQSSSSAGGGGVQINKKAIKEEFENE